MGINVHRQSTGTKRGKTAVLTEAFAHMQYTVKASALHSSNHPSIHSFTSQGLLFGPSACGANVKRLPIIFLLMRKHQSEGSCTSSCQFTPRHCSSLKTSKSCKTVCTGNCTFYNFLCTPRTVSTWYFDVFCQAAVWLRQCGRGCVGDWQPRLQELDQISASRIS